MSSVLDLINAIEAGKTRECESTFEALIHAKIAEKMEERRSEISTGMFESVGLDESKELDEAINLRINPASGEDRSKILAACDDVRAKVIDERDKDGYVVIKLAPDSLDAATLKGHIKTKYKGKFK
jgi:hypothetical protein